MSKENKNNLYAFPLDANTCLDEYKGMTLRDYFANSAMQGFCSSREQWESLMMDRPNYTISEDYVAQESYKLADAMLKQREL